MSRAGDVSVAAKLVGFAAVLAVVFAVAFGIGAATEPDPPSAPGAPTTLTTPASPTTVMDMDHGGEHGS